MEPSILAEEKTLSDAQQRCIELFVDNLTPEDIAGHLGVNKSTIYRWKKDEFFSAALAQAIENGAFDADNPLAPEIEKNQANLGREIGFIRDVGVWGLFPRPRWAPGCEFVVVDDHSEGHAFDTYSEAVRYWVDLSCDEFLKKYRNECFEIPLDDPARQSWTGMRAIVASAFECPSRARSYVAYLGPRAWSFTSRVEAEQFLNRILLIRDSEGREMGTTYDPHTASTNFRGY